MEVFEISNNRVRIPGIENELDLFYLHDKGLPGSALRDLMALYELGVGELTLLLNTSRSTLERRLQDGKNLGPYLTDALIELVKIYSKGLEVFEDRGDFLKWLNTPNYYYYDMTPMATLRNGTGRSLVLADLHKLEHSILP
ncbi:hypothetical protein D770_26250 [Flammeovirgaceae bacterium 311]|nr:hypothetical protein D770_26250 [Flammeovirgaceae bacterium 311]